MGTNSAWVYAGSLIYFFVFVGTVVVIGRWARGRKKLRDPVEFKLLRGPGESLRRRMAKFDEDLFQYAVAAAVSPVFVALAFFWCLATVAPKAPVIPSVSITGLVLLISGVFSGRWLWSKFTHYRDDRLGYFGERTVAESLAPLLREGYHVFHDVPASSGGRVFNLDHVVGGPTGLLLIETKTRRKGRARPGFKDHVVTYDGRQLIWPWGEDRHGLDQAESEARWLSDWINKLTGLSLSARPILVLPGWWINESPGPLRVVNAKGLCAAIRGRRERVLTDPQIDQIARLLDERCRDVVD
jgi:hypothetical protein